MTKERREEIFSKEILTADEIAELFQISLYTAREFIRTVKRKIDHLKIEGKLLISDYLQYIELPEGQIARYEKLKKVEG